MGAVRKAFAANLAYHRERRGLTQAKLAALVQTSPSYIGHLERGDREPSLLMIEEVASALGIQAGEFFVVRQSSDGQQRVKEELNELLRSCSSDDVAMAIRLVRAALDHPRLRGASDGGSVEKSQRNPQRRRRR